MPGVVEERLRVLPAENAFQVGLGVDRPPDIVVSLVYWVLRARTDRRAHAAGELQDLRNCPSRINPRSKTRTHHSPPQVAARSSSRRSRKSRLAPSTSRSNITARSEGPVVTLHVLPGDGSAEPLIVISTRPCPAGFTEYSTATLLLFASCGPGQRLTACGPHAPGAHTSRELSPAARELNQRAHP
jgi:hypothetical protein